MEGFCARCNKVTEVKSVARKNKEMQSVLYRCLACKNDDCILSVYHKNKKPKNGQEYDVEFTGELLSLFLPKINRLKQPSKKKEGSHL